MSALLDAPLDAPGDFGYIHAAGSLNTSARTTRDGISIGRMILSTVALFRENVSQPFTLITADSDWSAKETACDKLTDLVLRKNLQTLPGVLQCLAKLRGRRLAKEGALMP
jgi:hypothetical protein